MFRRWNLCELFDQEIIVIQRAIFTTLLGLWNQWEYICSNKMQETGCQPLLFFFENRYWEMFLGKKVHFLMLPTLQDFYEKDALVVFPTLYGCFMVNICCSLFELWNPISAENVNLCGLNILRSRQITRRLGGSSIVSAILIRLFWAKVSLSRNELLRNLI